MNGDGFTDESLRESMAELGEPSGEGRGCPDSEKIFLSAQRELEPEENEEILVHVAECPACAMSWRIAQDMGERPAGARPVSTGRGRLWTGLAAAAVVVVAVGLGIVFRSGPVVEQEAPLRAQEETWFRNALGEDAILPRGEFVLSWEEGPEGTMYSVLATSESLEFITQVEGLTTNELRIPIDVLDSIPSGSKVLWQVSARLSDGRFVESESHITGVE